AEPRKVSPPPDGERAWARFDSTAFLLLAVGLALSAAVLSAGTADLNGDWAAVRTSTHNWLGPAGAWLARSLVESLGTAVYFLLLGWIVASLDLFFRPRWWPWLRRLAGWLVLVPATAVLCDRLGPQWLGASLAGSGGTLGASLAAWLSAEFAPWQRAAVMSLALVIGITLATDRVLVLLARWTGNLVRGFGRGLVSIGSRFLRIRRLRVSRMPIYSSRAAGRIIARSAAPKTKSDPAAPPEVYTLPPIELLDEPVPHRIDDQEERLRERAQLLETTFTDFGLNIRV